MQTSHSIKPLKYMPALDGLRGVSIIAVMIGHANHFVVQGGSLGVDIFFGLSGFLITSLLLQEWEQDGRINFKSFYLRRALRLFPALFVLAASAVVYATFFLPPDKRADLLLATATSVGYVTNWFAAFGQFKMGGLGLGHTWSLSVEEQFYFVWPILLLGLLKLRLRPWRVVAILAVAVVLVAIERTMLWRHGAAYDRLYRGSDVRADSLLMGAIVGLIGTWRLINPDDRNVRLAIGLWTAISSVILVGMIFVIKWGAERQMIYLCGYGGFTLVAASVAGILLSLRTFPGSRLQRFLEMPLLVWIGKISYGLYLWHWFIYLIIEDHLPGGGWKVIVGEKIGLSFAAALLSYWCVEMPFLRWKNRLSIRPPVHAVAPLAASSQ